jgi:hypothetical protein
MSLVVTTGVAAIPAPAVRASVARPPSAAVVELTGALTNMPADGKTFIELSGKSAQGLVLVVGKIASKLGCAVRTQNVSDTNVRVWKIALTAEQVEARKAAKAARKAKLAAKALAD